MEFYTSSGLTRPVRLCEKTRQFCYESQNHKYGLDTLKVPNINLEHIDGFSEMTPSEQYDVALAEIAKNAPIRICNGELLSGAATLGDAISHSLPILHSRFQNSCITATSHLTVDFFEVLKIGMNGIRDKVKKSLDLHTEEKKQIFLKSCLSTIDSMEIWHKRYLDALEEKGGYEKNIKNLSRVPFKPPENFYEAVQSIWFCFSFLRLLGNWPGIGRLDVLLGEYLNSDLSRGILTIDEAREILAHFFIKGCEWITGTSGGSGDAQHYQNIVLSGTDENGEDITNEVTYLVLEILEETGISDFPTTVRINSHSSEKLIAKVADVIRLGGGILAIYNEDLILESLTKLGYSAKEATTFANDGCWEIQIPGKTNFTYLPFDSLKILQEETLNSYSKDVCFSSFDELLTAFERDIYRTVQRQFEECVLPMFKNEEFDYVEAFPCTAVSLFEQDCVGRGLSYREGGTVYSIRSPHIGGLPDAVNSLYAIKKAVFDEHLISMSDFLKILKNNWQGAEELRNTVRGYTYFGNDNDEVDLLAVEILDSFSDSCMEFNKKSPVLFVSGVSTFGRQIEWAPHRLATPFGRKSGEILSGNLSPTPGTDRYGAAAIIKSYCKADLSKQYTGAALDIGLNASTFADNNMISVISGLIKSFVLLGGHFMQIDTISKATLMDAKNHPENYQNLSIRISGWNARFVTLNEDWQNMIIERT